MRRYLPLFLVAFFVVVTVILCSTNLAGYADEKNPDYIKNINVYTTLPVEQLSVLAEEYEKNQNVHVNITPLSTKELINLVEKNNNLQLDIIITDSFTLEQIKALNALIPFTSEQSDVIPKKFKDSNNYWTGLWYDPIVFAANQDFLQKLPKQPVKWLDIIQDNKYRIGMTDFLAAEASANLLYTLVSVNGEAEAFSYLNKIHHQIVQYSKFLATPVRMASLGEVDIAIAVQSEALRYVNDKFPIKIIYPEEGTAFTLTGAGLYSGSSHQVGSKQFIDWLLQDNAQMVLEKNKFYFIPTNPETTLYKQYAEKNIKLFDIKEQLIAPQRSLLLDKWVQNIRLTTK